MKAMFVLLLTANVAFASYAYWSSTIGRPGAALVAQQIEPEKIKLLTRDQAASMGVARNTLLACLEWGAFSSAELAKANETLDTLAAGVDKRERVVARDAGNRVYLQLREVPEAVRARLTDLKAAFPAAEVRDCSPV